MAAAVRYEHEASLRWKQCSKKGGVERQKEPGTLTASWGPFSSSLDYLLLQFPLHDRKTTHSAFLWLLRPWWSQDLNQSQTHVFDPQTMLNHSYPHQRGAITTVVTNCGQESLEKSCFRSSPSEQLELPIPLPSHNNFNFITPTEDMVLVKDKSRNSLILHNFLYWEYLHRRAQIYRQEQSKCLKQKAPNLASPLDWLCDLRKITSFLSLPFSYMSIKWTLVP